MGECYDIQYKRILQEIGEEYDGNMDRTGVGTYKVFDANISVDLTPPEEGLYVLPALGLRKVYPRVAYHELFWMLSGSTDVRELQKRNVKIWDDNSSRDFLDRSGLEHIREGFIGKGYGHQFRNFGGVDQLQQVFEGLIKNPQGRRHLISLWNPADLHETALPPCHLLYQFVVTKDNTLNLKFYQRSCDFILGAPTNMMFSGFFLNFMSSILGYTPGKVAHSIGDCHVYKNHVDVALDLLDRVPCEGQNCVYAHKDELKGSMIEDIDVYLNHYKEQWDNIEFVRYDCHAPIEKERLIMAV